MVFNHSKMTWNIVEKMSIFVYIICLHGTRTTSHLPKLRNREDAKIRPLNNPRTEHTLSGLTSAVTNGYWDVNNIHNMTTYGPYVHCYRQDGPYNAVWKDKDPFISGERYWEFVFYRVEGAVMLGLRNYNSLFSTDKGSSPWFGKQGVFRKDNERNNRGPTIKSGDTVGMLAVFSLKEIHIYFKYNRGNLLKGFSVSAIDVHFPFPVIQFYEVGTVSCTAYSEKESRRFSKRRPEIKNYVGIQGLWVFDSLKTIREEGVEAFYKTAFDLRPMLTMTLKGDFLSVFVENPSSMMFHFYRHRDAWTPGMKSSQCLEEPGFYKGFEKHLAKILEDPDLITYNKTTLVFEKKNAFSSWTRESNYNVSDECMRVRR